LATVQLIPISLDSLDNAPLNANRMSPTKYLQLIESIKRIGFSVPITVRAKGDRYEIIDGHHRAKAVREIGATQTIPAIVLGANEDPRLVALALNRLRGETDLSIASELLANLIDDGFHYDDLQIAGFSELELQELVHSLKQIDPDLEDLDGAEMPEEIGTPVARPFLLELTFRNREDLAEAKRALRKACGKGGDLADGLLRLTRG
jgi:ParB-like chromosome segregation protein Spo0J